jgi:hypothetical protein
MLVAAAVLGVLAVLLAVPVPLLLARAGWTRRAPGAAAVLWQAIALAGGLSMIGSLAILGLAPLGDDLGEAGARALGDLADGSAPAVPLLPTLALGAAALLAAHLLLNLLLTAIATVRERARHRALVGLLSEPLPDRPDAQLIDDPAPVAYCVPGDGSASLTVVSAGLVRLLEQDELEAVIAHERAHLVQRHDLLTTAFQAWSLSLPWFPIARSAKREVATLVELLADDRALRTVSRDALRRAITRVSAATPGHRDSARVRLARLEAPSLAAPARAAVIAGAAALVLVPTSLLVLSTAPVLGA